MTDEKWENLTSQISEKFGIEEKKSVENNISDDVGNEFAGTKDIIIFDGMQGKMKLERINHPLIENKKMHYHKGTGGTAEVEYEVSETEQTHKVTAYIWDDSIDDWEEMQLPSGTMSF